MMIDDDTLKRLLRINDELLQLCKFLNERRYGNFISPHTTGGRPDAHSDRSWQEQIRLMMQPYKGYFIDGSALVVHPFSSNWYVGGNVYVSGPYSSIVEITRFQLQRFTVGVKELPDGWGWTLRVGWT